VLAGIEWMDVLGCDDVGWTNAISREDGAIVCARYQGLGFLVQVAMCYFYVQLGRSG